MKVDEAPWTRVTCTESYPGQFVPVTVTWFPEAPGVGDTAIVAGPAAEAA
jgi:hypothetical protein